MLPEATRDWLSAHAESLDADARQAPAVVPQLAQAGVLGVGLSTSLGGRGGAVSEAVEAVAQVAQHSLSAAFAFWGQRVLIHLLANTDITALRDRHLPALLAGELAGAGRALGRADLRGRRHARARRRGARAGPSGLAL